MIPVFINIKTQEKKEWKNNIKGFIDYYIDF